MPSPKHGASFALSPSQHTRSGDASSTTSSSNAESQSFTDQSTPNTSDDGKDLGDDTEPREDLGSDGGARPPGKGVTLDIVAPSRLRGYVLFAVQGSRRLQKARTRLAQIGVEVFNSDDKFFDEMGIQFRFLR